MLAIIRLIYLLFHFLVINLLLILVCLLRPFHRDNVYVGGKLYSTMAWVFGLKLQFEMPDSLSKRGPYVFIANHQNSYDLVTICGAAQPGMVTVGKKSLKWIPVFGLVYWLSGNILIDRRNSGRAHGTLQQTIEKIRQSRRSVWFFPEGTRSYGRGLLPFKTGAFRIAKATQEPVVTVCASNLHNKIKLNRWNNGTLIIKFSEPQTLDDSKDIRAWSDHFHQQMREQIAELDKRVAEMEK